LKNMCEQIIHLATLESQSRSEVNTRNFVEEFKKKLSGEISWQNFLKLAKDTRLVDYLTPQFLLNFEHWSCLFSLVTDDDSTINEDTQELFSMLKSNSSTDKSSRLIAEG